ncbi:hypothetical protein SUDANB145_07244 (plasmid) [Streptomyces sp. enrichment culture]|uniref:hypothetical protein n=1 Tax=Streptomyces sp. enrichment culture TaxID=1795815 RepID=UPI003F549549
MTFTEPGASGPCPPYAAAMTLAAAARTVAEGELRVLEAQLAAQDALGLDLEAIARQAASDREDAAQDKERMRELMQWVQQHRDTASLEELRDMEEQGRKLVERAEARAARRAEMERAMELLAAAQARVLE